MLCGCYYSLKAVGLKSVCKGARASKITIRNRLALKKHPISKDPTRGIHRVFLGTDTRPLAVMVASIVGKTIAERGGGKCPQGSRDADSPISERRRGDCPPWDPFGEDGCAWDDDEDPFLDIAHA